MATAAVVDDKKSGSAINDGEYPYRRHPPVVRDEEAVSPGEYIGSTLF